MAQSKAYEEIELMHNDLLQKDIELSAASMLTSVLELALIGGTERTRLPAALGDLYSECADELKPYIKQREELIELIKGSIGASGTSTGETVLAYIKFFPNKMIPVLEEQVLINAPQMLQHAYPFEFSRDKSPLKVLRDYLEGRKAGTRTELLKRVKNEVSLTHGYWVQMQKQAVKMLVTQLRTAVEPRTFSSDDDMGEWLENISELSKLIDYEMEELTAIGSGAAEEMKSQVAPLAKIAKDKVVAVVKHLASTGYMSP